MSEPLKMLRERSRGDDAAFRNARARDAFWKRWEETFRPLAATQ